MQYGDLITRAFRITWQRRYLWLLAVLGGADAGAGGFSGSFRFPAAPGGSPGTTPSAGTGADAVARFVQDHLDLLVAVGVILLLLVLAWFLLSCVTTGALVRASAEHDADRPFALGLAWRAGLASFGPILGLRLVGLLLVVVTLAAVAALAVLALVSLFVPGNPGSLVGIIAGGILVAAVLAVLATAVGLVFLLATRAIVLEQLGPIAALGRGVGLLRGRLGRVLLVWVIQVCLALAAGLALAVAGAIVVVTAGLGIVAAAVAGGPVPALAVGIPVGIVVLSLFVVLSGALGAYLSTYWTLAFRRLETDWPRPVVAWPPTAYPGRSAG